MSHSYPNLLIHCVCSTKERRNSIPEELREKLWKYLAAIGDGHKLPVLEAGGTANHVHMLIALPADMSLSKGYSLICLVFATTLPIHRPRGFQSGFARPCASGH